MSRQEDFFQQLATLLESAGIPFMVSGSLASSFHGNPRATNDFDLVIDPNPNSLNRLIEESLVRLLHELDLQNPR